MVKEIYKESKKLRAIAKALIFHVERVGHVDLSEVAFFNEIGTKPKALARCYRFESHPITFYTDFKFAVVVYEQNTDYMSENQLKILVLHELMHLPIIGDKLIDHDMKDFSSLLRLNVDWAQPNQEVPDIAGLTI